MRETLKLPSQSAGVITLRQPEAIRPEAIVSHTVHQSPELRVVLFHFDAGQELTEHTSPHRALVQVLTGSCSFKLGETWHDLVAGDLVHMPPHLPHGVRASEPFSMLLTLSPTQRERPAVSSLPAALQPLPNS